MENEKSRAVISAENPKQTRQAVKKIFSSQSSEREESSPADIDDPSGQPEGHRGAQQVKNGPSRFTVSWCEGWFLLPEVFHMGEEISNRGNPYLNLLMLC